MRKIKIWNKSISTGIALYENSILVTDFQGFGSKFSTRINNKKVSAIIPEFEKITLNLYFGVEGDAYSDYADLIELITENGLDNLVIEYDYGKGSRYCDVVLESAPKTQKTTYSVINETFVFQRLTPWYQYVTWTYSGSLPHTLTVDNTTPYNLEMYFRFGSEPGETGLVTFIKRNMLDAELGRIVYNLDEAKSIVEIDAETKTVIKTTFGTGVKVNTYDKINHAYNTFMIFEPGEKGKIYIPEPVPYLDSLSVIYKFWILE